MVDVPTPDEVAAEAEEGNEPTSLGDVAAAGQEAVRDDEIVPDRREEPGE